MAARPADPCPVSFALPRDTLSKRSGAAADSAGGTATVEELGVFTTVSAPLLAVSLTKQLQEKHRHKGSYT